MRSRAWCFTINNPTSLDERLVEGLSTEVRFLVCGREKGEQGTPHLQGYVYYHHAKTMSAVAKDLPRAHLVAAKGTPEQNEEYCLKEGDCFCKAGERPCTPQEKGKKEIERYDSAREAAKEGRWDDIPSDIFIRHYSSLKKIHNDQVRPVEPLPALANWWFVGPPNTGKSRAAREEYPPTYAKAKNKWWDGYPGDEATVVVDEVQPDDAWLGYFLKIWGDHYPFSAEAKGSSTIIRPRRIIVTSNYAISECFPDPVVVAAIERRYVVREFV